MFAFSLGDVKKRHTTQFNWESRIILFCAVILFNGCGEGGGSVNQKIDPPILEAGLSHEWNLDELGFAIHGYDPVSYSQASGPVLGKSEIQTTWSGAKWRFASEENRAAFIATPEKYVPANGGYCTFGVVLGKKFDGDPQVWSSNGGQYHLFLNEEVREKFLQDTEGNFSKVSTNWPEIKAKSPSELE